MVRWGCSVGAGTSGRLRGWSALLQGRRDQAVATLQHASAIAPTGPDSEADALDIKVLSGVFQPDAAGRAETIVGTPIDVTAMPVAIAVTVEPAGGVPAPTGDRYLVGLVSAL